MLKHLWKLGLGLLAVLATVAALAEALWWGALLMALTPGLALALMVIAPLCQGRGRGFAAGLGIVLTAYIIVRLPPRAARGTETDCTIVFWNAAVANESLSAGAGRLLSLNADIVVLAEVSPVWAAELTALDESYQWQLVAPREGPDGMGIWSRFPLRDAREVHPDATWQRPVLFTKVAHPAGDFDLVAVHPTAPIGPARQVRFDAVDEALHGLGRRVVVVGDMNRTPWMHRLRRLAKREDLRLAGSLGPTWPRQISPFGLPLDQILVSPVIAVREFERAPFWGSDHRPVVAQLDL